MNITVKTVLKCTITLSYMSLLRILDSEVLQVTSLHAVTVRENELSLASPESVTGTPGMTSFDDRMRETTLLMLRV